MGEEDTREQAEVVMEEKKRSYKELDLQTLLIS